MFGLQGYGFNDQERSNVTDQFIRSIFADLARNAPTLHQGGIGSSVSSIDDIARAMYERKQQEAADSQQAEQQAFYRDLASRQQGLSEEKHADGKQAELAAQFQAMLERDQAAKQGEIDTQISNRAFQSSAEDRARQRIAFDGENTGEGSEALGMMFNQDPEAAIKELAKRTAPKKPSSSGGGEQGVYHPGVTIGDKKYARNPFTNELVPLEAPEGSEEAPDPNKWNRPYSKSRFDREADRVRETGGLDMPLEEVAAKAHENLSRLYGSKGPSADSSTELSPQDQASVDIAKTMSPEEARAGLEAMNIPPERIERILASAFK